MPSKFPNEAVVEEHEIHEEDYFPLKEGSEDIFKGEFFTYRLLPQGKKKYPSFSVGLPRVRYTDELGIIEWCGKYQEFIFRAGEDVRLTRHGLQEIRMFLRVVLDWETGD